MAKPACKRTPTGLFQAIVVFCVVLIASAVHAIHRTTPFLVNLSNGPGGSSVTPGPSRGAPIRTAFDSVSDLKHNGSTGRQLFYFSLSPTAADARQLFQITNFSGDSQNGVADGVSGS